MDAEYPGDAGHQGMVHWRDSQVLLGGPVPGKEGFNPGDGRVLIADHLHPIDEQRAEQHI